MLHDDDTLRYLDNYNKKTKDRTEQYKESGQIISKRREKPFIEKIEDFEYASFVDRLIATLIDSVIVVIPLTLIESTYKVATHNIFNITTFELVLPLIITVLFWVKMGGTPGKMLMNMIIVDKESKNKLTVTQSILRYFGYIPSTIFFLFGFIWIAIDDKNQGWHDKLAGTIVIKQKKNNFIE